MTIKTPTELVKEAIRKNLTLFPLRPEYEAVKAVIAENEYLRQEIIDLNIVIQKGLELRSDAYDRITELETVLRKKT